MWPLTNKPKTNPSAAEPWARQAFSGTALKLQMCPAEGFLPAGHPGSSPTHPPCRRAWCPHRADCRGRPLSAAGGPAPPSARRPRRWTCQRAAPAAPAATWEAQNRLCSASGTSHRHTGHWGFMSCVVTCWGHLVSNPLCGLQGIASAQLWYLNIPEEFSPHSLP